MAADKVAGTVRGIFILAGLGWARTSCSDGDVITMLLYLVLLGGLGILLLASASTVRDAIRQRAGPRGILISFGFALLSLLGIWAILV